ncbi:signal peptidase I [Paenibacillus albiflavus]|uniref:Signal peptidase I n=1 Tax=Paenibacillus albiflavus TaxID=2545760 RepID=A0A4V2WN96_9BACL|nr:signal peptidase I [Paenibacillus albiflavus]TCZ74632.1 signal peptidase I [Paenibacillus albiflavus]
MRYILKWIKEYGLSIVIAIVLALFINTYVAQAVIVPTNSMDPTIKVDDRLVLQKWSLNDLQHGDIVAFWPPIPDNHDAYIKRLIGLPGDTIEVKDGALYRNGEKLDEPYVKVHINYTFPKVVVPSGKYFFLGDNRNVSNDSHKWPTPFVDESEIIGKAWIRFFPFGSFGSIE